MKPPANCSYFQTLQPTRSVHENEAHHCPSGHESPTPPTNHHSNQTLIRDPNQALGFRHEWKPPCHDVSLMFSLGMRQRLIPTWVRTVRAMREAGVQVRWSCRTCGQWGDADLELTERAKGPDFCLINRRPKCRQPNCNGHVLFLYSPGGGTPFAPLLWDEE